MFMRSLRALIVAYGWMLPREVEISSDLIDLSGSNPEDWILHYIRTYELNTTLSTHEMFAKYSWPHSAGSVKFVPICGILAQTKPVFSNYVNERHKFPLKFINLHFLLGTLKTTIVTLKFNLYIRNYYNRLDAFAKGWYFSLLYLACCTWESSMRILDSGAMQLSGLQTCQIN